MTLNPPTQAKTRSWTQAFRYLIPFLDGDVAHWSMEARLLRWLTFLWLFLGLMVLFSASFPVADAEYGDGLYYFKRQLVWIALGMVGFSVVVRSPIRRLLNLARWLMPFFVFLIVITLIPGIGTTVNGATRWLTLFFIPLQPSELIKPVLILQSASIFGRWPKLPWIVRGIWLSIFAIMLGAILLQPNLSTAALCGMSLWLMALAAGLPWLALWGTAGSGLVLGLFSIGIQDYQRRRVISFLNPWADPMQDGYQLIQSLLAVGSGGLWGSGYGLSQQKLFYLPIQYTDFIFAVFAEEFGLVGGILLLLLLGCYATLAVWVALKSRYAVHQLIAMGAMIFLVGQALVNIAVATGMLPTTGLPLPFFSYGGSSVIASLAIAGLLIRVARESTVAEVVSLQGRRTKPHSTPPNPTPPENP
ncbi:FtsW/RodA/SpoVE family cell cycle protein [Spirulina major CS-329]|uniref:FtsW/RodA/SpoVE family cell cycle protein n=1 Tax=Spirulina TaxID=1154 RepID=UPI00232FD5C9|nr:MULTISPECIES: FtsW/RodA/SpoVE family cell cycle protein [Spirulina]MDB9494028.1 FtsW/RodA/SpoVE family cell cycle protein [Spirulina subsalsa CS-330]MDB9502240.1 FtsW/RodA/SpoVE family cell cycle protein [Spirulina major CS-329]